jgi:hypothetical protein
MGAYKDADQLYELLGELFEELKNDPVIAEKIAASGLVIKYEYTDPDAEIWIDASEKDPAKSRVICGPPPDDLEAEVTMTMKADVAHQFWLGNVNLMVALTRKQIVAKGPIPKTMKLLPVIKPAYQMYRDLLTSKGLENMISK